MNSVHDTFRVLNLKKCLADANLHVPLDKIKVDKTLHFVEEPVEIMDQEIKKLKHRKIALVKVRWNSKRGPEFTWEHEDQIRIKLVIPLEMAKGSFLYDFLCAMCYKCVQSSLNSDNGKEWRIACNARNWKLRFEHSGGLLAGIHGLFSGRYCGLDRRVTCEYPWPGLEGNHRDFGIQQDEVKVRKSS
ncbi:hypothetical protein Tco_1129770 [Tanacetum coccineum]